MDQNAVSSKSNWLSDLMLHICSQNCQYHGNFEACESYALINSLSSLTEEKLLFYEKQQLEHTVEWMHELIWNLVTKVKSSD